MSEQKTKIVPAETLTRREMFAAMILPRFITLLPKERMPDPAEVARASVVYADALIAELDAPVPAPETKA